MRFIHISDLHFGKMVHGVSMLENGDQPYWVERFLDLTRELRPQAVLISGDVYDRSSPSGDAVEWMSRLVEGLSDQGICVLMVAGNHDSGRRLAFARDILARQNIHIAGTVNKQMIHVTLSDEYGPVTFWLMPYVFPAAVVPALKDETIRDYDAAVRRLIQAQEIDTGVRNVIIAHQNVTAFGAEGLRGGSAGPYPRGLPGWAGDRPLRGIAHVLSLQRDQTGRQRAGPGGNGEEGGSGADPNQGDSASASHAGDAGRI